MAQIDPINYGGAPDLLRSVQAGVNIRQAKDRATLAREKYNVELGQLTKENERQRKLDEEKTEDRAVGIDEKNLLRAIELGDYEEADRLRESLNERTGTNIQGNYAEMGKYLKKMIQADEGTDPDAREFHDRRFLDKFNIPISQAAKVLGRPDITRDIELQEKLATEEREFGTFKKEETFKSQLTREEKILGAELKGPGKPESYSGPSGRWEKGPKGRWNLVVKDPKASAGDVDKVKRELNLTEKIGKKVMKEADRKFGKEERRTEFSPQRGKYYKNVSYDFEGREAFVSQRMEELRTKAGISDIFAETTGGEVEGEVAGPPLPPVPANIPEAPQVPEEVSGRFTSQGFADQGLRLGNIVTEGQYKGAYEVLDASGKQVNYYK